MTRQPFSVLLTICLWTHQASADQTISDDLIVRNPDTHTGLCVGQDCQVEELFDADSLRLRNANNNILIDDISQSGFFADTDWRLQFNSPLVYGESFFAVEDITAGTLPFKIDSGAPTTSFVMSEFGRIGMGTAFPQADFEIYRPAPEIRLRPELAAGDFSLKVDSDGFALRQNNFSTIPFAVRAGVSNYTLMMTGNRIGSGTSFPDSALHLWRDDGSAAMLIEEVSSGPLGQLTLRNNGITWFALEDSSLPPGDHTGRIWNFQNNGGTFRVTTAPGGPGEIEMRMEPDGDMHIKGQLYTGTGGGSTTCQGGCDAVFDADYPLPSIADHLAEMRAKRHLPAVGPTPENGPYNLSQMTGGMLNELEKAHLYIGQLHADHTAALERIAALEAAMAQMMAHD